MNIGPLLLHSDPLRVVTEFIQGVSTTLDPLAQTLDRREEAPYLPNRGGAWWMRESHPWCPGTVACPRHDGGAERGADKAGQVRFEGLGFGF